ncbi:MerR family regulatory protein [Actinopolymorpha cephalotaxi]|uniref:MerR family regulatory protein n=1 Tax=Actinopolymorpha cephalotaxi TaxID=504797 RepID=A0A1I2VH24_9ACTN|nr:MerR family regulatory protein [Actinopolymorpha cephalotaxi]
MRALRYYEEQGLLASRRCPNGYREYDESAVARVGQIQLLYSAGLCSSKIVELLPCIRSDGERVIPSAGLVGDLQVERTRILRRIEEMAASLRVLDGVIAAAEPSEPSPVAASPVAASPLTASPVAASAG